jgi:hypothetical protein
VSGHNAAYALPLDERPPGYLPEIPAPTLPADEPEPELALPSPPPAKKRPEPAYYDRMRGVSVEGAAILDRITECRALVDQLEQTGAEMSAAMVERHWSFLCSSVTRLQALSGHLLKTIERRK